MWMRSKIRIVAYKPCSLGGSYFERMDLPSDVSVVMIFVAALKGQVLGTRVLEASQSFALSTSA
jgi:hypothetical protein